MMKYGKRLGRFPKIRNLHSCIISYIHRTALRRQGSINSNTSDFDYETPRVMAQDNDAWIPHTARSYTSNNDVPLTARSYTSNTELNQYSYAEEKPQSFRASSSNLPYIQQDEKQYYRGNQLAVHSEQDEYTLGVMEGIGEEDIEEVFSYARHGRIDDIESVLARGMPINIRDEWGSTLLIIACQNGNKRVAKLVLRRGADINARNHKGNTPLHYCYQCKSPVVHISALVD